MRSVSVPVSVDEEEAYATGARIQKELVELAAKDWRAYDALKNIFQALRDPDFDTSYSYDLGVALSGRLRAALSGEADEYEKWVRRVSALERALVHLFKEYVKAREAGRELEHVHGLRRYLDRVHAAFETLSRLAPRGEHRRLYADLAAVADRLAGFAYALDTDSFFEAVDTAVERGLARPLALRVELLRLEDNRLLTKFYEEWKRRGQQGLTLWGSSLAR